jgi:hypothetical protein
VFTRWTTRELALFGRNSDSDIARVTSRSLQAVRLKRFKLAIPPVNPRYKHWIPKEIRLLGKFPDRVLARRLNRSLLSVQMKRRKLRIPTPLLLR